MEIKKSESKPFVIIICVIVGLFLVGFGVWYGVSYFEGDEKPSDQTGEPIPETPSEEPSSQNPNGGNNTPSGPVGEKIDFPKNADSDFVYIGEFFEILDVENLSTNFKNLKKEKNGNTFVYNCEKYTKEADDEACSSIKLTLNNEISINGYYLVGIGVVGEEVYIYKYKNYYILFSSFVEGGFDDNTLSIYKNNKEIYKADAISHYWIIDGLQEASNHINVKPTVYNGVLHFVEPTNSTGSNFDKLKYNNIDLTKDNIEVKLIKEFKGYFESSASQYER